MLWSMTRRRMINSQRWLTPRARSLERRPSPARTASCHGTPAGGTSTLERRDAGAFRAPPGREPRRRPGTARFNPSTPAKPPRSYWTVFERTSPCRRRIAPGTRAGTVRGMGSFPHRQSTVSCHHGSRNNSGVSSSRFHWAHSRFPWIHEIQGQDTSSPWKKSVRYVGLLRQLGGERLSGLARPVSI